MSTLSQRAESAHSHYEAEAAKLLREDGSRRFSDKEHAERDAALKGELGAALDTVEASADEELSRSEATLASHADKSSQLSVEELTAANARARFVAENAENLPVDELATLAEAAASSGDKVSLFLYARYGRTRAEREKAAQPGVEFTEEYERLSAALDQLEEGLMTQEERRATKAITEAREVKDRLYLLRRGVTSPLELAMNRRYS